MDSLREEQRSIVKFLYNEGIKPSEIQRRLARQDSDSAFSLSAVYMWISSFKKGRTSCKDLPRMGRPVSTFTDANAAKVSDIIAQDRRVSISYICRVSDLSRCCVQRIIHQKLNLTKRCARWVPHHLQEEQKQTRLRVCSELLARYNRHGRRFLSRIITADETWLHHYEPESKRSSMQWLKPKEPSPTKYRAEKSNAKAHAIVFWDCHGVILTHMVELGCTITAEYYARVLEEVLEPVLRTKRPGLRGNQLIFQHDNARPHTAKKTTAAIRRLGWETLPHPPYSPDLAPCDYYLFWKMKEYIRGKSFKSRSALASSVSQFVRSLSAEDCASGMSQLPSRWRKCIDVMGDYFE